MRLSDFYYDLPPELIARYPLANRSDSKLLCLSSKTGQIVHKQFKDLISLISPNDLLIFNNTRVIAARLMGEKESGGRIEMLVERILDNHHILAHIRASKSPKPGSELLFENDVRFQVIRRRENLFELRLLHETPVLEIIESIGEIPLPPYFQRKAEEQDKKRYQTIYAEHKGSVAAPTAGLHFDEEIMNSLRAKKVAIGFVTLHVGAGTFAPVRVEDITQHKIHAEFLMVSKELCEKITETRANGGRIIAVGTTTARCLETAGRDGDIKPFQGDTDIFIYPGYQFKFVDVLITNLHLPGSTLLMLVAALGGYQNVMRAYQKAIAQKYRFFSYGDAMWVESHCA